ncbi:tetratricopeptide repeat protein [Sphingomonas sp. ZT3P38]|uniref:tetratricopeptide repeat protein n=1 Tax=Parasphingomonas zepuensis TaxID=3096161 RepID=UPI002FCA80EC
MKTRAILTLGVTAMVACGGLAGIATHGGMAFASARSEPQAELDAASEAGKAQKALAKGKVFQAVTHAEEAVRLRPQVATFRVLLATSYLRAGRFVSARQAYADAVSLEPGNGAVSLNLALAQIATGDWAGARQTLDTHKDSIPVSDRGLATALAGDPAAAVEMLADAVRTPGADAKVRQNFALSLALAGRWQDARTMVSLDLDPALVDQRIAQWAEFARPESASDQVASLLGVTPVRDQGQPVALALNKAPDVAVASVETPVSGEAGVAPETEVAVAQAPVPAFSDVSFGPREEIVQRLPSKGRAAGPARLARGTAAPRAQPKGGYFVQLGAFRNAAVAKDAWTRVRRADARFAAQTPSGMSISSKAGSFYRLSVGGFARGEADALCSGYKAKGGTCFVRAHAGDQVAVWARPGGQLASR